MNLGYMVSSLSTGGAEMMLLRQIRHSERSETVFNLGSGGDLLSKFKNAGATVVNLDISSVLKPSDLNAVRSALGKYEVDILHAHLPSSMVVARLAGRAAGIDTIVSTHHNSKYPRDLRAIERATRPLDTHQIAVSDSVQHHQESIVGNGEWSVIYNGIDIVSFNRQVRNASVPDNMASDGPTFLNIGRYVPQKGQKYLIRAMERVVTELPGAHAVIVGHGPLQDELEALVAERGLEDSITLTGRVPEVYGYYAAADMFVFSSLFEGLPVTGLEAMAAELPIVGTRVAGIKEIVDDGETGYLVPPESPKFLAETMVRMASSEYEMMNQRAFERASSRFSIRQMHASHNQLYQKLY